MKKILYILILCVCSPMVMMGETKQLKESDQKKVRNFINEGNEQYRASNFDKALELYSRALEIDDKNAITLYNYANALSARFGNTPVTDEQAEAKSLINNALNIYDKIYEDIENPSDLREKAAFNSGNLFFNQMDYKQSIEAYKKVLKLNPENEAARENLRLAQLKNKEQEQNQNQDKQDNQNNQNNQDNQNKQDNKDNQQNDQNNQDNKDNQYQKDNKSDQNNDRQQDQNKSQSQSKDNKDQKNGQQPQGAPVQPKMTRENAERFLQAAENKEKETRDKAEKREVPTGKYIEKPW